MKKTIGLMCLIVGAALTGCGHSDSSPATQTSGVNSPAPAGDIGGICTDRTIQDYRNFQDKCGIRDGQRGRFDDQCRGVADAFMHDHPGVSCSMPRQPGDQGAVEARRIEAKEIQAYGSDNAIR